MNRIILTMLIILAMSIVAFCGCESKEPSAESESGKTAPEFTLANYDDKPISLSDYKGKIAVLEWLNYECPFVRHHYEEAKTTPHMFIIDTKGIIAYAGAIDNSPLGREKEGVINYVDKALTELTTGKTISISNTEPYGCSVKYAN